MATTKCVTDGKSAESKTKGDHGKVKREKRLTNRVQMENRWETVSKTKNGSSGTKNKSIFRRSRWNWVGIKTSWCGVCYQLCYAIHTVSNTISYQQAALHYASFYRLCPSVTELVSSRYYDWQVWPHCKVKSHSSDGGMTFNELKPYISWYIQSDLLTNNPVLIIRAPSMWTTTHTELHYAKAQRCIKEQSKESNLKNFFTNMFLMLAIVAAALHWESCTFANKLNISIAVKSFWSRGWH